MTTVEAAPQHLAALARANEIRLARAAVKRDVKAGRVTVADAMELECCATMTLGELLGAQRSWGPLRSRRLLQRVPLSDAKRVGTLTDRQRLVLVELIG